MEWSKSSFFSMDFFKKEKLDSGCMNSSLYKIWVYMKPKLYESGII